MKSKNLFRIGLGIFIAVFILTGCVSSKPSSYQVKVNSIDMPIGEKQILLNNVLAEKYGKNVNGYQVYNGCVSFNYNVAWMNQQFSNCYEIKNDKIVRQDYSQCYYYNKKDTCRYAGINFDTDVKEYSKFLDSININNEYNKKLISHRNSYKSNKKEYDSFVKKYNNEKNKLKNKLALTKNKIVDYSGILPKDLLNKFEFKNLEIISSENDCYRKFKNSNSFKNCFNVKGGIKNYKMIENTGFSFTIKNWSFNKNIYELSNPIVYEVNSDIKFNFLPKNFYTENKDLKVHVSSDYDIIFTISNKTNEFVEIKNVSLYWDSKINSMPTKETLPPQSISKVAKMNILQIEDKPTYQIKYKNIKSLNDSTKFGVAVQYVISNKKQNLYKTKTFTVSDLYKNYKK